MPLPVPHILPAIRGVFRLCSRGNQFRPVLAFILFPRETGICRKIMKKIDQDIFVEKKDQKHRSIPRLFPPSQKSWIRHCSWPMNVVAVAVPGFPRQETPTSEEVRQSIIWQHFCQKLYENEKIWIERRGTSLAPPLRSATVMRGNFRRGSPLPFAPLASRLCCCLCNNLIFGLYNSLRTIRHCI